MFRMESVIIRYPQLIESRANNYIVIENRKILISLIELNSIRLVSSVDSLQYEQFYKKFSLQHIERAPIKSQRIGNFQAKELQKSNSKLVTSCGGRLPAHLLSLHNRASVAGSRSTLTSHRLINTRALVKISIYLFYLSTRSQLFMARD